MTTLSAVCYHYLARDDEFRRIWGHSFELFKKHIEFFKTKYTVISPQDVLQENFEDNKDYLLLTFDDGLREHVKIADYLGSQNLKAVFAVPTCIFRGELLNPQIIHFGCAYYGVRKFYLFIKKEIEENFQECRHLLIAEPEKEEVMQLHKKLKVLFKRDLDFSVSRKILRNVLAGYLKKDFPNIVERVHLNKDDLLHMVVQGNYIASHSDSHPVVSEITDRPDIFNTEILESKRILEDITHKPVEIFAYPFGEKPDVLADPAPFVQSGYKQILTTYQESFDFNQLHLGRYCSQSQDEVKDLTEHMWDYNIRPL